MGIAARQKVLTQMMPKIEQENWDVVYQNALSTERLVALDNEPTPTSAALQPPLPRGENSLIAEFAGV